jgi:acyl-CoA dehydrogenase
MGLVALGYMWCRIAEAALAGLAGDASAERRHDRLVTDRFFVERIRPETALYLSRIRPGAGNVIELSAEAF